MSRSLKLIVTPLARRGEIIVANIEAVDLPETILQLAIPDTIVISAPLHQVIGRGTFKVQKSWTVEHVQPGKTALVEITATAGPLVQTGICRVF